MGPNVSALFKEMESYYPLELDLKKYLEEVVLQKEYERHALILNAGQVPPAAYFLLQGTARSYYFNAETGVQVTTWFWHKGDIIIPDGFCRRKFSRFYLEIMETSNVQYLPFNLVETAAARFPIFYPLELAIGEDYHSRMQLHYHECRQLPVKARFEKLMQQHAAVFNIAPVKDIASFLGMFPDTLSRLRAGRKF